MRASPHQRRKNAFKHRLGLSQHIVIPEPDHTKPEARKIPRSLQIKTQIVGMLSAIYLDDQSRADAHEVDNVAANRLLPSESILAEMPIAQMAPEMSFCIGRAIA